MKRLSSKARKHNRQQLVLFRSERDKKQGEVSLKAAIDAVNAFCDAWGRISLDTLDVVQNAVQCRRHGSIPDLCALPKCMPILSAPREMKSLRLDVAHEVLKEWFYAVVGNDQYREAWLDESFAVYGEFVYQLYTGESETDVQARVDSLDCSIKAKNILISATISILTNIPATAI